MTRTGRTIGTIAAFVLLLLAGLAAHPALAAQDAGGIGQRDMTIVDETRGIKATQGFAGSETRRLDIKVWYPAKAKGDGIVAAAPVASGGPRPLVIYSHGTFGAADNAMHIVRALVNGGYIVAAPDYPLSSRAAYTKIKFADISGVADQVRDVRVIIDRLLADPVLGKAIDAEAIGVTGHSLGAVTSYFAIYGDKLRDPRIKAAAPIAAGDPVQTALSNDMGLWGTQHAAVSVPVLFLTAGKDVFSRTTGQPHAAYSRVEAPKYELLIPAGVHVWFRDGDEQPAGNKNPDCLFFEQNMPGITMPGCEERVPLIGPARQQEITRAALLAFFDGYLKGDKDALARLRAMGEADDVRLVFEE